MMVIYKQIMPRYCLGKDCKKRATFGKKGSRTTLYCKGCIPKGKENEYCRTNGGSGSCRHVNCNSRAQYGKRSTKKREFCGRHVPENEKDN